MAKVVLQLQKKNPLEKVGLTRHIVEDMNGNINFSTPNPALADLTAAADALETAVDDVEDAREALIAAIDVLDQREAELVNLVTLEGYYVQQVSGGNKAIIESAGMKTQAASESKPAPVAVVNFLMNEVKNQPLMIDASWKSMLKEYNVQFYQLRIKVGSVEAGEWIEMTDATTRKARVRFQAPAAGRVWGQVRAKNAAGFGPWSDPATIVVENPL